MTHDILLVVFAGLVNWLVTTIIVEGVIFTDLRRRLDVFGLSHGWGYYTELWHCHLCAGTWVGILLAVLVGGPMVVGLPGGFGGVASVLINGFLYKAAGHIILEATAMMKNHNAMATGDEKRRVIYEAERVLREKVFNNHD